MNTRKQTPDGVRDVLPDECAGRRRIEETIRARFALCGYQEIAPPVVEFFSLYNPLQTTNLVKTFDKQGRILALRPDITTSVARIAATGLADAPRPLRLCYLGKAFSNQYDRPGKTLEFTQAGVELIGIGGPEADAEVIALAASAMARAGLLDFLIDIGQVGFFKGLMEELGIEPSEAERLRQSVEEKNVLEMEMRLRQLSLGDGARERLMALPMLYGGLEVLDEAAGLTDNPTSLRALENIRAVYGLLRDYGLEKHISIDLGLVHEIDYYTGTVFRGISASLGVPILSGGRYDHMGDGRPGADPATGFALGIERLIDAVDRQKGSTPIERHIDIVAGCAGRFSAAAIERIEEMRASGERVELFYSASDDDLQKRAALFGARAVRFEGEAIRWL